MAEGVTLRFQRDDSGRPLVMYIRDLNGVCPICGWEVIERTYDQIDYHLLTVGRFRQLVSSAPAQFETVCEQCGEDMGPESVEKWSVCYGFPLEAGLIQGFGRHQLGVSSVEFVLSPHREMDAQMQPEWTAEQDQSVARMEQMSEMEVGRELGRFLSLKAGWRRGIKGFIAQPGLDRATISLATDTFGLLARSEAALAEEIRVLLERQGGSLDAHWVTTQLADDINELMENNPREWLPETWYRRLVTGELWAVAAADVRTSERALRRALEALPGPTEIEVDESFDAKVRFVMGDEPPFETEVSLKLAALEALVSGASPLDWVRLWLDDTIARITSQSDESRVAES